MGADTTSSSSQLVDLVVNGVEIKLHAGVPVVTNDGSGLTAAQVSTIVDTKLAAVQTQGKPGNDGAAATIGIDTTVQTAAGTAPVVTNTGTANAAKLKFSFPAPAQGLKGDTGAAGKGISTTAVTYQIGTSGTTAPTSTWTAVIPALVKGKYLWTRTVLTYTDATTVTSYSVSYTANDGTNGTGTAGAAGSKIIKLTAAPTATDGADGDWGILTTTTPPTLYGPKGSTTAGQWPTPGFPLGSTTTSTGGGTTTPSIPVVTFYGTNNHFTWAADDPARPSYIEKFWAGQIQQMVDLGAKTTRGGFGVFIDYKGDLDSDASTYINYIDNYATPYGVVVCPVLMGDYDPGYNGSNVTTNTEATAYTVGYNLGAKAALLKGRVPHYEIGNEDDSYALLGSDRSGRDKSDYDLHRFNISRGYKRGMIDGIRSIDTTTPIVMGGITWVHTAYLEMMWNGTAPDGSTGHPTVRWNKTALHWYCNNYSGNDNIENVIDQSGFNLLSWAKTTFGVPIHINEWGANSDTYSNSETAISNALVGTLLMGKFQSVAKTYGIEHICYYQLTDGAAPGTPTGDRELNFGLVAIDSVTKKGRYTPFKAKIAAMPNPLA